jgi:hypothetical protein
MEEGGVRWLELVGWLVGRGGGVGSGVVGDVVGGRGGARTGTSRRSVYTDFLNGLESIRFHTDDSSLGTSWGTSPCTPCARGLCMTKG